MADYGQYAKNLKKTGGLLFDSYKQDMMKEAGQDRQYLKL